MRVILVPVVLALLQGPPVPDVRVVITSDGWTLAGDYWRPPGSGRIPGVLLLHGAARDRRQYQALAAELAQRGVASLRIDLRGEGESTNLGRFVPGRTDALLEGTERDVAVAIRWLRQQPGIDPARIGVLGASYSGEAMARAAREGTPAAAYVALSPGSLSEESMRAIDPAGRPWWVIGSRHERFAIEVVREVAGLSRTARVTVLEGTSHGSDLLSPHDLNAEVADWFAGRLAERIRPPAWGSLEPGAHAVGFQRATLGAGPRRTVLDTWYPARDGHVPMRFGEYLTLADDLRGAIAGDLPATLSATITGDAKTLDRGLAQRLLETPMGAVRDANPVGRFPVVIWTPRYGTTAAQAVLSEYLASHGFLVAFARPAAPPPMPFELADAAGKRAELAARVDDMRGALEHLRALPTADTTAVGVLAWSYTGEMATVFQIREPSVALVAGLSTNLFDGWVYQPADAIAGLDASRLTASYALLAQEGHRSIGTGRPFGDLAARIGGARYAVALPGLAHGSFNALEGFLPSLFGIASVQPFSTSGPHGVRGYEAVAVMTLRLLRRHVAARSTVPLTELMLTSGLRADTAKVIELGAASR